MSIIFMRSPCGLCISWESYLFGVVIHSERTAFGKQEKTGLLHIKCIWGAERRSQQGASICHRLLTRLSAVDSFPWKRSHEAGINGGWRSMGGDLLTEMCLDFFFLFLFSCVACDMLSWFTHTGKGAFLWLTDAHYCRFSKSWAMMVKTSLTNALSIWIILYLQSLLSQAFEKKFHHRVVLYWLHQNLYVFWWQNIQLVKIWFSKHQIFTGNSLSPLTLVITQ